MKHRYLVLLSVCLCQTIFGGIMFGASPLLVGILGTFGTTRVQAGLVFSMMSTLFCVTALFAGAFLHKYGAWITCCIGSVIIAIAFSVSVVATSVIHLVIAVGVFAGSGLALLFIGCAPTICQYFTGRSQVIALTVMHLSSGLGAISSSYVLGVLLECYGIRGTFLLIGGFTLNAAVVSPLWKKSPLINTSTSKVSFGENNTANVHRRSIKETVKYVFTDRVFMLFAIGNGFNIAAQHNASIYMVDTMKDIHTSNSIALLTPVLFNISSLVGRLLCGVIKLVPHCSSLDVALLSAAMGIVGCLFIVLGDSILVKIVAWCLNGAALGIAMTGISITAAKLLGRENMSTGIGFLLTVRGVMGTVGGPLNGYIRDVTGSYQFVLIYTSGVLLVAGILYALAKVYRRRENQSNDDNDCTVVNRASNIDVIAPELGIVEE